MSTIEQHFSLREGTSFCHEVVYQCASKGSRPKQNGGKREQILLLMAEFGKPGEPAPLIPKISQETLAEMIGTTRSRVSFFMNRFRKLGLIDYSGRIRVHKSLLDMVLHDRLPD